MSLCSMDSSGEGMNANELADAMEIRASIRRKATSRKSVTEGANDRLADQLDQAATMLRQQQAEIEALKKQCALLQAGYNAQAILLGAENVELLETEIFVKGAVLKSYKEALEQIATGEIANESTNYKDTVYVMRQIASDALAILRKAQE